jgi:hypothetical protein
MLKYPDEWAFVSLYDGLGGPPIFCGLLVYQRSVDWAVGSGGCFLRLLLFCLLFWLVLSVLEMQVSTVHAVVSDIMHTSPEDIFQLHPAIVILNFFV